MKSHLSVLFKYVCVGFVASIVMAFLDHNRLPSWLLASIAFVFLANCLLAYRK